MKKASSTTATNKVREIEPFDKRSVTLTKFKTDIALNDWKSLVGTSIRAFPPFFFLPIDTLSPTKTIGRGRTNTTIIAPTIVQTDAATPHATFDRQVVTFRNPIIQVHFEPSAYGITTVSDYFIQFRIEVFGQGTFNLQGFAGAGTIANAGSKVLSGQTTVTLVMRNVPPSQQTFAFLEQTAGPRWSWFSTQISLPPLVITQ